MATADFALGSRHGNMFQRVSVPTSRQPRGLTVTVLNKRVPTKENPRRNNKPNLKTRKGKCLYNDRFMEVVVQKPFQFRVPFDYEERTVQPEEIIWMRWPDFNNRFAPQRFVKKLTDNVKAQMKADQEAQERKEQEEVAKARAVGAAIQQQQVVIFRKTDDSNIALEQGERVFPNDIVQAVEEAVGVKLDANKIQLGSVKTIGMVEVSYKALPQVITKFKISIKSSN